MALGEEAMISDPPAAEVEKRVKNCRTRSSRSSFDGGKEKAECADSAEVVDQGIQAVAGGGNSSW